MRASLWCLAAAAMLVTGCSEESDSGLGGNGTTSGSGGGSGSGGAAPVFDPDNPGVHMFLELGAVQMMGQPIELAIAGFLPTAREDFEPEQTGAQIPIDTCVISEQQPATPRCSGDQDCAPEQQCQPDTDGDGNPIPNSDRCVTPREPMDVGPMALEGLAIGPTQMTYNSGQDGAYTVPGTDGSMQAGSLAFNTTYTFHGDGDPTKGLGAFSGEIHLGAQLQLTSPPMVELGMPGMFGIRVDPNQDLVLQWTASDPSSQVDINLSGADGTPIDCRVSDDGEFTIGVDMVTAAGLGGFALMNMITIGQEGEGTASGEGLTYHAIGSLQTLAINVARGP